VVIRLSTVVCGLAALVTLAALGIWLAGRRPAHPKIDPMAGYITDVAVLEREYAAAHGRLLNNVEARQLFQRAAELARNGEYRPAAELLETASKTAAVPAVFNDLGVLYAKLDDRSRTVNAFREALARDGNYAPVLQNLERLRGITEDEARPVTREIEPNATNSTANVIAVGSQVEAEIAAGLNDVDTFKFPSPQAPRDILVLDIATRSPDLILGWNIYDDAVNLIARVKDERKPGAPVHFSFAPPPNATFFLSVWGIDQTAGAYTITLKALKAFDAYEPNDDIFHAHPIPLGQTIQANIMDGQDQDFYSFLADRSGTVDIALENLSPTLIPGLTAFGPDQRTIGFAPDAAGPGASLRYSIAVEADHKYYLQVWPVLERSSGEYTLRLELR
jgi:hypothetical protein